MGSDILSQKKRVIKMRPNIFRTRFVVFLFLIVALIWTQHNYDIEHTRVPQDLSTQPLGFVKAFDIGLHSAVASLLWINVRTELPFIQFGPQKFDNDLA